MKVRVYYEDTDCGGIVYHANYIKFCERARSEMFFESGLNFSDNGGFVVTNINANFIKPAVLGDLLEVRSYLVTLKKASIILCQEIYKIGYLNSSCEPVLIFNAQINLAFMAHSKVAKISDEVVEFLNTIKTQTSLPL